MDTNDQAGTNGEEAATEDELQVQRNALAAQRHAAEKERERLAERTIEMLREFLHTALTTELGVRIDDTPYGPLWNIGTVDTALVLACEDGRAFNIVVHYDSFVGSTRWQKIALMRAEGNGHEPGPWEYAGQLGYISTCHRCGGMMACGSDKRPHGEQFSRPCTVTVSQQRMDLDYDPTSEE
jgi:ribosomal protein L31E